MQWAFAGFDIWKEKGVKLFNTRQGQDNDNHREIPCNGVISYSVPIHCSAVGFDALPQTQRLFSRLGVANLLVGTLKAYEYLHQRSLSWPGGSLYRQSRSFGGFNLLVQCGSRLGAPCARNGSSFTGHELKKALSQGLLSSTLHLLLADKIVIRRNSSGAASRSKPVPTHTPFSFPSAHEPKRTNLPTFLASLVERGCWYTLPS